MPYDEINEMMQQISEERARKGLVKRPDHILCWEAYRRLPTTTLGGRRHYAVDEEEAEWDELDKQQLKAIAVAKALGLPIPPPRTLQSKRNNPVIAAPRVTRSGKEFGAPVAAPGARVTRSGRAFAAPAPVAASAAPAPALVAAPAPAPVFAAPPRDVRAPVASTRAAPAPAPAPVAAPARPAPVFAAPPRDVRAPAAPTRAPVVAARVAHAPPPARGAVGPQPRARRARDSPEVEVMFHRRPAAQGDSFAVAPKRYMKIGGETVERPSSLRPGSTPDPDVYQRHRSPIRRIAPLRPNQ